MWGTGSVRRLCRQAKHSGYNRLALTDTDNLYGLWPFVDACKEYGLEPIIGAEVTDPTRSHRAVCLVKNAVGYSNLSRLLTKRHTQDGFRLETMLPGVSGGLAVLTSDPSLLAVWHETGVDVAASLPRHPLHRNHLLVRRARQLNIPLVATPGSFFLKKDGGKIHQLLRAIHNNSIVSKLGPGDVAPEDAFFGSPAYYKERFSLCPEALKNSHELAEKLAFAQPGFGTVMPPYGGKDSMDSEQLLSARAMEGARKRYGPNLSEAVRQRLNYELGIIQEKKFCEYFLVVQDIVQKSSRICGRGSGAASIVAFCLGITNVCPIKFNLYFERFLNPGRTDPPDIDIDFAWDERDGILNHVLEKFKGHSAMVSSHILFQPRMAGREVAKVFGLPDGEIGKVSKKLPWFWQQKEADGDLLETIRKRPEFRFMDFPQPWPGIMAFAQAITGTPRYLSVHPGGVVITPDPIDGYVPIETAPKGVPMMQWDKEGAERAGLVKIDLLGNRSLGVIRDSLASIKTDRPGFNVFNGDPEDDFETQNMVAQGNTMGCFYIESPAMRLLQKKSRTGDFGHVVIHSSIIRPAANDYIKAYLERLHTGVWKPIHPILEGILTETFGIMVYQEDVSKVAVAMAGFSHIEADGLRKIISKKDKQQELNDYYQRFETGAKGRGVHKEVIQTVWQMITSFSGYSFCKPHSASYARVSFQAAFLKTHYPAQFMAAVISNQGGFYSTFAYVSEARRQGVEILGPDVDSSDIAWKGQGRVIRVGLMSVKALSGNTMKTILTERRKAIFRDAGDFFDRVRPHENEARALIHSGGLDGFEPSGNRASLLWAFSAWQKQKEAVPDGLLPFGSTGPVAALPQLPPEDRLERLRREFSVLGFLCSRHPMELCQRAIKGRNILKADRLPGFIGKKVRFAGWLLTGKTVRTKHGDPMKFLTFEDETGMVETVFFPKAYALFCHILDRGRPYLLSGRVDSDWGAVTLTVERTEQLSL